MFQLYTIILGLFCCYTSSIIYHLNVTLLIIFGVYAYRDVYPLCTYSSVVQDGSEGWILWTKIGVLFAVAALIPLLIPRVYVPLNAADEEKPLNPEQTASWASLLSYSFLDRFVVFAYRSSRISEDQLPPLAEYDDARNLKARGFTRLDPSFGAPKRHIFFGLMRIFSFEYIILILMSLLNITAEFASPVGINRLLNYIETGGQDAVVPLWFWISWLFFSPVIQSLAKEYYQFIANRMQVQAEALLTELIFEHSLRIRPVNDTHRAAEDEGKEDPDRNIVGRLNNLVTTDLANVMAAKDFFELFVQTPVQIVLCVFFLYIVLGWSAFVGLAIILVSIPIPGFVGKRMHGVQTDLLQRTDSRVSQVVEYADFDPLHAVNLIRMIKLFGWQKQIGEKIHQKREEELKWIWKREFLGLSNKIVNFLLPILTLLGTYCTYTTIIMKGELSASKVFSTMTVITMFRTQLYIISATITSTITGKVSLDRIDDFLQNTELLDKYSENVPASLLATAHSGVIGFNNATFSWSGKATPSDRNFVLQIGPELTFKHGSFNIIVGPTGAGKTSLLMALLGEMHFIPRGSDSWFNLPRKEGVAYAAQESWLQNDTIKANVLFGSPFNAERYHKVLYQCGLEHDISLFEDGDLTLIGEKGSTMSGGQKARLTLARAVYASSEILLLDDVLAALDVHTAKWIVNKCFTGDLVKGRTVLLVTHNVALVSPVADFVVSVGLDGRAIGESSIKKAIANDSFLLAEFEKDEGAIRKYAEEVDTVTAPGENVPAGRLVVEEEKEEGHVNWSSIKIYFDGLAGNHRFFFYSCFFLTMMFSNVSIVGQTGYLGYWASKYDDHPASEVPVYYYVSVFAMIVFSSIFWHLICQIVFIKGALRASKTIHRQLMDAILGTTLRWIDITPTSRVITRATQDMGVVDGPLREELFLLWNVISFLLIQFAVVVVISPIFFIPGLLLVVAGSCLSQVYMGAQLSVKREMSNARAPVLAHFSASVAGLASIRAYGAQNAFVNGSLTRINSYSRASRAFYNLSRWISLRLDVLSACFATALAVYLVYVQSLNAATSGFSLSTGVGFSALTLYLVQVLNAFEVQSKTNSITIERIRQYITIEQESKPNKPRKPPAYWPTSGALQVEHLSARYSSDGPYVLHDISFTVKSGERIGIVGRTGSGKSSLTLALLRGIQTNGEVFYDGIPTSDLEVETLRSNITFIPQIPELLSGSLRYNLDPFGQFEDARLNDAIRASGLYSLQPEADENRLTLDTTIASGGSNVSVGQRQMLAIARAIIRGSKLLILDEEIDHQTDKVIQTSLRSGLAEDVTLIAVAHRLQTILDADRIMVLDDGCIAEFDAPKALLEKEGGLFRQLVDQSEDKEALYKIAFSQ
ncbi:P-loop containing nucleoside triphosphate hydrolase protein [Rhodocollybia butyracea]|uniref:P-loop containing nucleoside triphosphate hydrolase protein n=1 Tax=Rhodocollybia butyracea TaxID=206335 RepID=A0A9P5Q365_9AGAR|nr:P-loop containing nucleoside triphosphate hydrolase protein [Rhodocollybia butyracea]